MCPPAHNDLYNLFPGEGEINGVRQDFNWGMVPGAANCDYGRCAMKIDAGQPPGRAAHRRQGRHRPRHVLHERAYGFNLADQDRQLFAAWARMDPPDAWEQERNRRIAAIQGKDNRFISQHAMVFGQTAAAPSSAAKPGWTCGAKTTCGQMAS